MSCRRFLYVKKLSVGEYKYRPAEKIQTFLQISRIFRANSLTLCIKYQPTMNEEAMSQLYLKDTAFQNLMQSRVFSVLLIASRYDAFMMEEDGRVEEQLYFEYVALNLSSPGYKSVACVRSH